MVTMKIVEIILIVFICCRTVDGRPQQTKPGCWYEGRRYQESQVVNTTEPCLRCRCNEGSLRCRLRVCPRLPSPPPYGCTMRTPEDNACCAELVCGDSHERNVTARRDPAKDIRSQDNGCLYEGVPYAPGSAMMGSRRCEYCYCISGNRRCLRPRCLLPLAGCTPLYSPYSCCPVAYNCTNSAHHSVSSLGSASSGNGCRVGSRRYDEGEMVRDIAQKADCDNCFCAMGGVRCVPLACAPPLQGCTPIVREGHCCPSTYNCSGTIEVKATQNYASYAFISKDYAKFRKETNFYSLDTDEDAREGGEEEEEEYEPPGNSTVEGRGHKNTQRRPGLAFPSLETSVNSPTTKSTNNTEAFVDHESTTVREMTTTMRGNKSTTISSQETETMDNEIPTETMDYGKSSTLQQGTTFEVGWTTVEPTEYSETLNFDTTQEDGNFDASSTETTAFTTVETSDATNSIVSSEDLQETWMPLLETSTVKFEAETTDYSTIEAASTTTEESVEGETSTIPLPEENSTFKAGSNATKDKLVTVGLTINTTELSKVVKSNVDDEKDISGTYEVGEQAVISVKSPATGLPTTILMPDNILVMNVTLKTNVSVGHVQGITMNPVRSIPPDIEAILNITHRKKGDDYDYEYSQPTLPPSLPNVRIIPFVAADALVKNDKEIPIPVTNYPMGSVGIPPQDLGPTVPGTMANFYDVATQENRFSPPIETEGGFVPREPPYFDPLYHPTDLNLEMRTGVTVVPADITNPHRKNDELATNCRFENRDFRHGDLLPSSGHCIICICYYGEVACSDEKCPPLKIGCRRLENEKICCGKIICVDSDESPTVVLDRADPVAASPRQPLPVIDGVVSPDPFRDVIKTKPAPDLPSLIEDMLPYLAERRITKPSTATTPMTTSTLESNVHSHYELEPDQNFPIDPSKDNIYLINKQQQQPPSKFNESSSPIDRTYVLQNHETSSSRNSTIEDPLELTTIMTNFDKPEISASSPPTKSEINSPEKLPDENDDSLLSFGSVFDMLFSENTESPATRIPNGSKNVEESTKTVMNKEEAEDSSLGYFPIPLKETEDEKGSFESSMNIASGKTTSTTTTGRTITWIKVEEATTRKTTMMTGNDAGGNSPTTSSSDSEIGTSVNSLLKLAGCNIYGRMYRVGRIITELSNPCLECRCTEVGVQCKQLEC